MKALSLTFPFDRCATFMAICLGLLNSIAIAQYTEAIAEKGESGAQLPTTRSKSVDFLREIQPILRNNCYECHAGSTEEGGLNLGMKAKAFRGGDSDAAILVGKSKESLLIQLVSRVDKDRLMPPEGNLPLTKKQISLLRAWIDQGAQWPDDADVADPKLDKAACNHLSWRFACKKRPLKSWIFRERRKQCMSFTVSTTRLPSRLGPSA